MKLIALPALSDNYIWLVHDAHHALVVDPAQAEPVLAWLQQHGLQLQAILVTHHHSDHIGGVAALRQTCAARVYGPAHESIPRPFTPLQQGDHVTALGRHFEVFDVPGHTAGHIAFFHDQPDVQGAPLLFCGDTLFSGGCGRIFDGTPAQLLASLDRLAALPGNTQVCCAHEYTLANLKFALAVEPDNLALHHYQAHCQQLRTNGLPTLPSSIAQELQINPFLRSRQPDVVRAARAFDTSAQDDVADFAALRRWKNQFVSGDFRHIKSLS